LKENILIPITINSLQVEKKTKIAQPTYRKKNSVSKYIDQLFEEEQFEDNDYENDVEENAFDSVNTVKKTD